MATTKNTQPKRISKFFHNKEVQINLANFLSYTAEEIDSVIRPLGFIDLATFDSLDEDEKEYYTCDLWSASDISADDIETLINEGEQSVDDYRLLSETLLNWKEGDPNPLTDSYLMSSFNWVKNKSGKKTIYELQHEAINHLPNYMLGDLFPYFETEVLTKEALDFIKKSNH